MKKCNFSKELFMSNSIKSTTSVSFAQNLKKGFMLIQKNKWATLLLPLCLLFSGCNTDTTGPDYSEQRETGTGTSSTEQRNLQPYYFGRELLNTEAKKGAFDLLVSTLINLDETKISALPEKAPYDPDEMVKEVVFDFSAFGLDSAEIDTIARYAFYSEPRLFHTLVKGVRPYYIEQDQNGNIAKASYFIKHEYSIDPSLYQTQMAAIDKKVELCLDRITPDMSDYEKHQMLFTLRDTDNPGFAAYDSTIEAHHSNIIGVFIDQKAICGGYAFAYLYLMQKAGLQGAWVQGNAFDPIPPAGAAHVWNYSKA